MKPQHRVLFHPEFVDLLEGDHLAALMLSQIVFWFTPGKSGKSKLRARGGLWLAKSHVDWWEELRLTRRQSQRCLAVLKSKGLIQTKLFRYDGHATIHLQLVGDPMHLQVHPVAPASATVVAPQSATKMHPEVQLITETTTETTTENTTTPAEAGKDSEQMKAAEVVKQFVDADVKAGGKGPLAMSILWKKHMGLHAQGFIKPLTGQELGQLKHVHKALGDDAYPVLEYALANWEKFAHEAAAAHGVPPAVTPTCGFFCKHYDVAVQLIAQANKPKPVAQAVGGALKIKQVKEEPLAGEQDIAETLEQLKALQQGK